MSEALYLRPDVQVEPLFDSWYAWSHLISPATAARNITDRHFKIMDSYIAAPQVHAAAVKNPKMLGGPFIDYGGQRVDEIKALKEQTVRERARQIELSAAITKLDELLRTSAKGSSLHPMYPQVPEMLRGYVELTYDLNHHPSFRVLEPLLYRSDLYAHSAQSLMLSTTSGDDRPFVLSTPRLDTPGTLRLPWRFDDERVDALFRLKRAPREWSAIKATLGIEDRDEALARSFFTTTPPAPYHAYDGPGVRWRYFGHACILVEIRGVSILLDPVLSYTYESDISRYTYADLPDRIDFVLITHNHQDHILFETLLQLRHKIGQIVVPRNGGGALQDPSLKLTLQAAGCSNVVELGEFETLTFAGGSITGLPFLGEHCDLAVMTKLAHLVQLGDVRLLFAADSCNIEPRVYQHVHRVLGDIDVLFLGMECDGAPLTWLYGPLLTKPIDRVMDQSRRLNGCDYAQGMAIVNEFNCKEAYVYAMGQEPWLNHVMSIKYTDHSRPIIESNRLIEDCRSRGITAERLFGEKEILIDRNPSPPYEMSSRSPQEPALST
jgi:L-ascorbate metabolism protein UlaG (beta-lactamase superfamily)